MVKMDNNETLVMYWNTPASDDKGNVELQAIEDRLLDVKIMYAGRAWLGFGIPTAATMFGNSSSLRLATAVVGSPHKSKVFKCWLNKSPSSSSSSSMMSLSSMWTSSSKMDRRHQTLRDVRLVQNENDTSLSFKKYVREIYQETEVDIVRNAKYTILLAVGSGNRFVHRHDGSGSERPYKAYALTLDLSQPAVDNKESSSKESSPTNKAVETSTEEKANDKQKIGARASVSSTETAMLKKRYSFVVCMISGIIATLIVVCVLCRSELYYYYRQACFRDPPLPKIIHCEESRLL